MRVHGFLLPRFATKHPFGPFNSVATQLKPIQQALLLLLRKQPELVVEILSGCSSVRYVRLPHTLFCTKFQGFSTYSVSRL